MPTLYITETTYSDFHSLTCYELALADGSFEHVVLAELPCGMYLNHPGKTAEVFRNFSGELGVVTRVFRFD